jgi:carbon starvation protein
VRDPLGGINSLWPLFGIANQLLAAIGLCLGTTIVLKMAIRSENSGGKARRPAWALITLVPLIWLLAVTMTAGVQKIFHSDPRIGFIAQAKILRGKASGLEQALAAAKATGGQIENATKALRSNRVLQFNNILDALVAGTFLLLVAAIVALSVREWVLLLARRKLVLLRETEPVWLPDYALAATKPLHLASLLALALALAKELSGEAQLERSRQQAAHDMTQTEGDVLSACKSDHGRSEQQLYLEVTERRFRGVRRCC